MILKVTLHDNDFSWPLECACQALLHNFVHFDAIHIAEIVADPDGIRRTLVISTLGHHVALYARYYMTHHYRLAHHLGKPESIKQFVMTRVNSLNYIDRKLSVEVIETMQNEPKWSNSQVVYVDFVNKTVENR